MKCTAYTQKNEHCKRTGKKYNGQIYCYQHKNWTQWEIDVTKKKVKEWEAIFLAWDLLNKEERI